MTWGEARDRLEELEGKAPELLHGLDGQELFVLRRLMYPMPCPLCGHQFGHPENHTTCLSCGIHLRRVVPFMPNNACGWYWEIEEDDKGELLLLWRAHTEGESS